MKPYVVDGLDCSGKKTVTRLLLERLRQCGIQADQVIGPLVGGALGRVDRYLANIVHRVPHGSPLDRCRRAVYIVEPVIDRLHQLSKRDVPIIKVSSHYRAWARTAVLPDPWMASAFAATAPLHARYAGATLLYTDFDVRLRRHHADVANGRTTKVVEHRFLGPDKDAFSRWHARLDKLLAAHVPDLLRIDTTNDDLEGIADHVTHHVLSCWKNR